MKNYIIRFLSKNGEPLAMEKAFKNKSEALNYFKRNQKPYGYKLREVVQSNKPYIKPSYTRETIGSMGYRK